MKKYYIVRGNFGNCYSLYWTNSPEMEKHLPSSAERITRKEAEALVREERSRRKYDQAFSGYADAYIYPADYCPETDEWMRYVDPSAIIVEKFKRNGALAS